MKHGLLPVSGFYDIAHRHASTWEFVTGRKPEEKTKPKQLVITDVGRVLTKLS